MRKRSVCEAPLRRPNKRRRSHRQSRRKSLEKNLVTSQGGFGEDVSAPLGFGLISGAADDDDEEDDAEPRSALLRTAGPHKKKGKRPCLLSHH